MRIEAEWLRAPPTVAVMAALSAHTALFVGGCVRNALLGAPAGDVDVATDARPQAVIAAAEAAGLKAVPTGIDHGTVTVVAGGVPVEVTTFRRDVATDGRRAVVAFADDPVADARRRDFTMNALYAHADGTVLDPLRGLPDLLARRVRFIGDPEARIREDFLRILRFFRFHAWYGTGPLDPAGLAACVALAPGLDTLSAERITQEIQKLLAAPDPTATLGAMAEAGILNRILPGAALWPRDPAAALWDLGRGAEAAGAARLAALGEARIAARLRLSKADAKRHAILAEAARGDAGPAILGYKMGAADAAAALAVRAALGRPPPPGAPAEIARGAAATFPVQAADLMPALQGPDLGAALTRLEDAWIAADLRPGKTELLAKLQ